MSEHPTEIKLHQQSRLLEITFDDNSSFKLPYEYLRVYSPSAEVRGHGTGQEKLQTGKINVGVVEILPVGSYAMKIVFDDGHDSGLYTWEYLYKLGKNHSLYWQEYLDKLAASGERREACGKPEGNCCGTGCNPS
jgi:DUF971 family protein